MMPRFIWPLVFLIAGCSTLQPVPPSGLMWAYFGESQTIPSLQVVVYLPDRPTCEENRVKDLKVPAAAEYARLKYSGECRRIAVGSGSDYWVFAILNGAVGAKDQDWCLKMREGLTQKYPARLGQCQPMGIRDLP